MEIKDGFTIVQYVQQLWGWRVDTTPGALFTEGFVMNAWRQWKAGQVCVAVGGGPVQLLSVAIWIILLALCFAPRFTLCHKHKIYLILSLKYS